MTLDELLRIEHDGWRSLCDGTGADFYGRVMTPDAVMVLADGRVRDRAEVVASLRDAPPWARYVIDEERLVPLGDDAAVLVYRGQGWREEGAPPFTGLMTSVYVRRGDDVALASYQQTPVPD